MSATRFMKALPLTIVTGASSNHFICLQNLLWSISKCQPDARVIVYNLGLTDAEHSVLRDMPPFYLERWEFRKFDFTKYPKHFDMTANSGRMAFRPVTLAAAAHEFGGVVMWLDAGTVLLEPLDQQRACIQKDGAYCPCAPGDIESLIYPSAIIPLGITDDLRKLPIRDAGMCGFDTTRPEVMALLDRWSAIAQDSICTAPEGSTRRTHRQDAVFAVLLYQAAKANGWTLEGRRLRGLAIKQDNVTLKETRYRIGL